MGGVGEGGGADARQLLPDRRIVARDGSVRDVTIDVTDDGPEPDIP